MWAIIIQNPLFKPAVLALLVVFAGLVVFQAGKWSQRVEIRAEAAEARLKNKENAERIEDEIDALDDSALRDELDGRLSGNGK